jgi:hypothetical protein
LCQVRICSTCLLCLEEIELCRSLKLPPRCSAKLIHLLAA